MNQIRKIFSYLNLAFWARGGINVYVVVVNGGKDGIAGTSVVTENINAKVNTLYCIQNKESAEFLANQMNLNAKNVGYNPENTEGNPNNTFSVIPAVLVLKK